MKIANILGVQIRRTRAQFIGESLAGCWIVALLGFSGYILHFNSAPVGFLFLLVVVSEAILCGFWQATVVSILACLCLGTAQHSRGCTAAHSDGAAVRAKPQYAFDQLASAARTAVDPIDSADFSGRGRRDLRRKFRQMRSSGRLV